MRPLEQRPVQLDIHLLVVEAQVARDGRRLAQRHAVEPHEVLVPLPVRQHDVVVLGLALVRARRARRRGPQQRPVDDRRGRKVVAAGEQGLVEVVGGGRAGEDGAVERDLDGPRRVEDVDALEGVAWVHVDGVVFFVVLFWFAGISISL